MGSVMEWEGRMIKSLYLKVVCTHRFCWPSWGLIGNRVMRDSGRSTCMKVECKVHYKPISRGSFVAEGMVRRQNSSLVDMAHKGYTQQAVVQVATS